MYTCEVTIFTNDVPSWRHEGTEPDKGLGMHSTPSVFGNGIIMADARDNGRV